MAKTHWRKMTNPNYMGAYSLDEGRCVGKWLTEYEPNGRPYQLHCSVCDPDFSIIGNKIASKFCPDCGARLEGVSEDA